MTAMSIGRRSVGALRRLALALAALCALAVPATAEGGANVMLVLDASGSMWSHIGDQTKIEIARDTVGTILQSWRPADALGLVVYGHRRKGDCADIEVVKPLGPVDPAALMAQVGGISPKGRTPMSEAVRLAADQLRSVEGQASVILVSDGIETCNADPCAVAASLKAADVHLVVHTVGFDIQDPEAARQLACMAKATGGLALTASNAKDLTKAIQDAVAVAQKDAPSAPPPPPEPEPAAPPAPVHYDYNLVGSARLSSDDDPLAGKDSIIWVFHKPAPEGATPEYVATSYSTRIEQQLEPGDYVVTTTAGAATVTTPVTIVPGQMNRLDVVLNAGRLGLRAKRTETQNEGGNVFWEVLKGDGSTVFNAYSPETSTVIPAGDYTVQLTLGAAKLTRSVTVAPGETTAVEIVAGVGRLSGHITFSRGGPAVKSPFIEIFNGTDPVPDEQSIANTYDDKPKFDLPAGAYHAHVRIDGVNRTFPFEIRVGETVEAEFALDAGLAAFEAPEADSVTLSGGEQDIYGEDASIATLYPAFPNYALPAGTYKATAHWGEAKAEATFEVAPGKRVVTRFVKP